jgi:prephenate dehydratase
VSRPIPHTPFQYRFDAVVAGHPLDPVVRDALASVRAVTRKLRVLGVYDAHEEDA